MLITSRHLTGLKTNQSVQELQVILPSSPCMWVQAASLDSGPLELRRAEGTRDEPGTTCHHPSAGPRTLGCCSECPLCSENNAATVRAVTFPAVTSPEMSIAQWESHLHCTHTILCASWRCCDLRTLSGSLYFRWHSRVQLSLKRIKHIGDKNTAEKPTLRGP